MKKTNDPWFSGWCTPGNQPWQHGHCKGEWNSTPCACKCHTPKSWSVFWTDLEGQRQEDADWAAFDAAQTYATCLLDYGIADTSQPIEIAHTGSGSW